MNETSNNYVSNRVLRMQVGFLFSEGVGHSLDAEFDVPTLRIDDDLTVNTLRGKLHLSRTPQGILVQGDLRAELGGECRRCLDEVNLSVDINIQELFVSPPRPDAEFSVSEDGILDLTPLVRDEIILATPMGVLCRPDCAGLCLICGANLNDGPCSCDDENLDPRLAALKALKDRLSDDKS